MEGLTSSAAWVATLALIVLLVLGALVLVRRLQGDGGSSIPALCRSKPDAPWCRASIRFLSDRVVIRCHGGPGPRVHGPWHRGRVDLGIAEHVHGDEVGGPTEAELIRVDLTHGESHLEIALDEPNYTALRAWVEAAPPGWNSQVA